MTKDEFIQEALSLAERAAKSGNPEISKPAHVVASVAGSLQSGHTHRLWDRVLEVFALDHFNLGTSRST